MKFFKGITLLAIASKAKANAGEAIRSQVSHDDLEPFSHFAYHDVQNLCASDVETYCIPKEDPPVMFLLSGDPFLDWIFAPPATLDVPTPPEIDDLDRFIGQMFNSFLVSSALTSESSTIVWFHEVSPETFVDAGVTRLAAEKEPEEIPELAHQLQKYGASLLQDSEAGSEQLQMARRLTEMDTKTINYHVQLPFGRSENCCLKWAFEQEIVSEKCAHSIRMLESTFVFETELSRHKQAFVVKTMVLHFVSYLMFMLLLAQYFRARRLGRRRLKQNIIQAVYTNPSIRKQVELEIGESIDYGVKEDLLVSHRGKKAIRNKTLRHSKKIVYEGIPLQVV